MYCEKCGSDIPEVEICPKCGCLSGYKVPKPVKAKNPAETQIILFKIISIVAIVLAVLSLIYQVISIFSIAKFSEKYSTDWFSVWIIFGIIFGLLFKTLMIVLPILLLLKKDKPFICLITVLGIYDIICFIRTIINSSQYLNLINYISMIIPIISYVLILITAVKRSNKTGIAAIVTCGISYIIYIITFLQNVIIIDSYQIAFIDIIGVFIINLNFVALSTALLFKILSEEKSEKTETVN